MLKKYLLIKLVTIITVCFGAHAQQGPVPQFAYKMLQDLCQHNAVANNKLWIVKEENNDITSYTLLGNFTHVHAEYNRKSDKVTGYWGGVEICGNYFFADKASQIYKTLIREYENQECNKAKKRKDLNQELLEYFKNKNH